MAERRMFSSSVVESDEFLDLPVSSQAFYFHLGMYADDDGIIGSTKRVIRTIGYSEDALQPLIDSGFIIQFDDNALVISDWKRNNYLQKDRYTPSYRQDIIHRLNYDQNQKRYFAKNGTYTNCIQDVSNDVHSEYTQIDREDKDSIVKERKKEVPPSAGSQKSKSSKSSKDYVPIYWEVSNKIPKKFYGQFKSEDDYYAYAQSHKDKIILALKEESSNT